MRDSKEILCFGDFELYVATAELKKSGVAIALQPQPLRVLAYLCGRSGELVTRDEIREAVWGEKEHLEFDQALNFCIRRIRSALGDDAKKPLFIETLARRGYRFIAVVSGTVSGTETKPATADATASVVVLPFVDFSASPQEYFSDGLTEEMINELGRLHPRRLRVIARTSTMRYKETKKSVRDIGEELGVTHALEGSVRKASGRVRISAQLVRVDDQSQVWAGSYDTDMGDILTVQREVANALTKEILSELVVPQGVALSRRLDPETLEQYLKGRYFWHRRTTSDLWKSVRCFERAIDRNPRYAVAHTGLADTYLTLLDYHELSAREALEPAKLAVAEALRLDPNLAETHSTLGHLSLHSYDWASAERAFRSAVELNPSYTMAHFYYSNYLLAMGRFEDSIEEAQRSIELDPVAAIVESNAAFAYYHAARYGEAIDSCHGALEMDGGFWAAHYDLGRIHLQLGEFRRALEELELAVKLSSGSHRPLAALGHAAGLAGERSMAESILERLLHRSGERDVWAYGVALVCLALGRLEDCLAWLGKAYDELDAGLVFLNVDPRLEGIRTHPEIRSLLDRMGLEN